MTDGLIAFYAARLDEAEALAKAAWPGPWDYVTETGGFGPVGWVRMPIPQHKGASTGLTSFTPLGTQDADTAAHIARHDPARALRDVEADRKLLAELEHAREHSDRVFGPEPPEGIASGEWPGERMRAATQVLTLERVVKIRAERFSDHPDYRAEWKP